MPVRSRIPGPTPKSLTVYEWGEELPPSFLNRALHSWEAIKEPAKGPPAGRLISKYNWVKGAHMFPQDSVHVPVTMSPAQSFPSHLCLWASAGQGLSPIHFCITTHIAGAHELGYDQMKAITYLCLQCLLKGWATWYIPHPSLPAPVQVSPPLRNNCPSLLTLPEDPVHAC